MRRCSLHLRLIYLGLRFRAYVSSNELGLKYRLWGLGFFGAVGVWGLGFRVDRCKKDCNILGHGKRESPAYGNYHLFHLLDHVSDRGISGVI